MPSEQEEETSSPASGAHEIPKIWQTVSAARTIALRVTTTQLRFRNTVEIQGPPFEKDITAPNAAAPTPRLLVPALRPSRTPIKRTRKESSHAKTAMGRKQAMNGATSGNKHHRGRRMVGDSDNGGGSPRPAAGEAKPEPKPAVNVSREIRGIITNANDNGVGAFESAVTEPEFEPALAAPDRTLRIVIYRGSSGDGKLKAVVTGPVEPEPTVTEGSGGDLIPSLAATPVAGSTLANVADCLTSFSTGEVTYGIELPGMPLPDLQLSNAEVVISPYDNIQIGAIKKFAEQLRAEKFGIDWDKIKRTPTWVILGIAVKVRHAQWDALLENLARKSGQHLGLGKSKLTAWLQALYL